MVLGVTHGPDSGGCCVTPRLLNGSLLPFIDLDNVTLRLHHLSTASSRQGFLSPCVCMCVQRIRSSLRLSHCKT